MKLIKCIAVIQLLLALTACGGGGGDASTSSSGTASIEGTGAVGAYLVGAEVIVKDSTGATVATTTTGADGTYSTGNFNPASFTPPFVVTINGTVGLSSETLVSVLATTPTANTVVNVTPVTNAISAFLSSTGNPLDLQTNIGSEKTNITSAAVIAAETAYRNLLAANMTAIGLPTATNLISAPYSANLDKLLDNVRIEVTPSGAVSMSTVAGSAMNDLVDTTTAPANAGTVVLAKGVLPTAANNASMPAMPTGTTTLGVNVLETLRQTINGCFALATANRSLAVSPCNKIVTANYLNSGRNASIEFGSTMPSALSSSLNDNLTLSSIEILRQIDTTLTREKILVRLNGTRTDKTVIDLITVAENSPTGWYLLGDQREFGATAYPEGRTVIFANRPSGNRFESGLNFYIRDTSLIANVVVTGPELPTAGIKLIRKAGCEGLAIENPAAPGTSGSCAGTYILASWLSNGDVFTPTTGSTYLYDLPFGTAEQLITKLSAIKVLDVYKFVITKTDATVLTYWNRIGARPPLYAELKQRVWATFTPSTVAQMTTGSTLYTGGTAPTVSWTSPTGAAKPFKVYFTHGAGNDSTMLYPLQTSTSIPCSLNTECNGTNYVSNISNTTLTYQFNLLSQNRSGTKFSYILRK